MLHITSQWTRRSGLEPCAHHRSRKDPILTIPTIHPHARSPCACSCHAIPVNLPFPFPFPCSLHLLPPCELVLFPADSVPSSIRQLHPVNVLGFFQLPLHPLPSPLPSRVCLCIPLVPFPPRAACIIYRHSTCLLPTTTTPQLALSSSPFLPRLDPVSKQKR